MLNTLMIQSGGGEQIPEISTLLLEMERVGVPIADARIHFVTYVRVPGSQTLRMAWDGPEIPVSLVQAISRRTPRAVFTLATLPLAEDAVPKVWRVVNGVDVAKVVEASGLAEEREQQ